MRKIFIGLTACVVLLTGLMSCQDRIDEQFIDPEKTSTASIPKFFTFMIDNSRVRPEYWNVRTFLAPHMALYTQTVSFTNATNRYQQQLNYLDDFWRDYYAPTAGGVVAQLREIEKTYATLTDEQKADAEVFLQAARVLYYDQTQQMVDMWGDIPYSQAGSINLTGQVVLPEFDQAQGIYMDILAGLKTASDYFATATPNSLVAASFAKQDLLMQGSLQGWRRYANSLRLRALMRISFTSEYENKARTEVLEMLNSPQQYPLVETAGQNILLVPTTTYLDNMRNALTELSSHVAPKFLLDDVMKPSNDPRIRVWFDKNVEVVSTTVRKWNPDYYALPTDLTATAQETNIGKGKYAILDSLTFLLNRSFPGIVVTSHEVQFLKAEAQERWGSTTDAQVSYEKGVSDAVKFIFYLNGLGRGNADPKDAPLDDAELVTFLSNSNVAYAGSKDDKLHKIWLQKWIGYGFMQSIQNWAEVRRTNYPVLNFSEDTSIADFKQPGTRLLYPPNERTYNSVNYAKVSNADNINGKIFWDVN